MLCGWPGVMQPAEGAQRLSAQVDHVAQAAKERTATIRVRERGVAAHRQLRMMHSRRVVPSSTRRIRTVSTDTFFDGALDRPPSS